MLLTVIDAASGDQRPADSSESSEEILTQKNDEAKDESDGCNNNMSADLPQPPNCHDSLTAAADDNLLLIDEDTHSKERKSCEIKNSKGSKFNQDDDNKDDDDDSDKNDMAAQEDYMDADDAEQVYVII